MRICKVYFPLFLLFLFVAKPVFSLNHDRHISQYGHTAWRIQDGYFGGKVRKITQTTDGYIWIGTEAGLFRFDGVRFVPWSSLDREQLSSAFIIALRAARDGSLWIGTDDGLAHSVNQHLITYLRGDFVTDILEDEHGEIWVAHSKTGDPSHPLCQVVDTTIRCYGSDDGVPPFDAQPLAQDRSGNLWVGGDTKLLTWRLGSSKVWLGPSQVYSPRPLQSGAGTGGGVRALAVAADGSLWVGMQLAGQGGLQHIVDGALKSFVTPKLNGETLGVNALLADRQNSLWVGTTNQGIYRIRGKEVEHFRITDGLSSDSVWTFFEDREGNLWVATSQGLDMFRDLHVSSFSAREGLSENSVNSVLASRDGTVWVGTAGNLEILGPDGVSSLPRRVLQGKQVASLFEDRAGHLWVGMDNTLLIYQHGKFREIKKQDGSPVGLTMGMTEDLENNIWVETFGPPGTLIRIQDLKVREDFRAPQMPLAQRLAPDPQSGVWLGLANGDLARYRSGKAETFHFVGHPNSQVRAIIAASDGSILGATAFGVLGWKNGIQQILTVRNGLPCDTIHALISDNQDNLWLHAQCGLIEIPNNEMQRWWEQPERRLKLKVFDASDGVQAGEGHFSTSARSPDGRLWFATRGVLQMVDPAHMAGNTVAPPVHINAVVADRKSYSPQEGLRLPPRTRDLEIDYTALSFAVPQKVVFRYMLEGHDGTWQESGTRRQAFYNDLPPGLYRFRVIACNNDGVWNEEGATLNFSVAPAWYQTNWLRFLSIFSGLFVAWSIYRLRLRQMAMSMSARFDERLAERTRMARELHDTFIQTVQGSKLVVDDALEKSGDPVLTHRALEQLSEWLARAIQEGRAALNSLRTSTTQRNDLADALQRATENGVLPTPIAVTFSVVGDARDMHPVVRDEVFRVGFEAIRNAYQHSSATQLEIELRYSQELTLRVSDNGVGVDPAIAEKGRDGHFGLQGMRERAARIGGTLTMMTSGSGTEIKLSVPGGIIFQTSRSFRKELLARMRTLLGYHPPPSSR